MARVVMLMMLAAAVAGCAAEEKTVVRDSTIARQFAQLNKSGWQVTSAENAEKRAAEPQRDVRVIKDADFSGLMFRTNFQIDDPKLKEQEEKQRREEAARQPQQNGPAPITPFGGLAPR
jgi:hypothetical protein